MRINHGAATIVVVCAVLCGSVSAARQMDDRNNGDLRDQRHRPPKPPIDLALDVDENQIIDADEIATSADALKSLDVDGDGRLIAGECLPSRPDQKTDSGGLSRSDRVRHHPRPPIFSALDASGDQVIDANEISASAEALSTLDSNGDGQLSPEEYRPRRRDRSNDRSPAARGAAMEPDSQRRVEE